MKCEFCGTEVSADRRDCPSCGAPCAGNAASQETVIHNSESSRNKTKDFVPMGSADISFLAEQTKEIEMANPRAILWIILGIILSIAILVLYFCL